MHMGVNIGSLINHDTGIGTGGTAVQNSHYGHGKSFFRDSEEACGRNVVFLSEIFADVSSSQDPFAFPVGDGGFTVEAHHFFGISLKEVLSERCAGEQHHCCEDKRQNLLHNNDFLSLMFL